MRKQIRRVFFGTAAAALTTSGACGGPQPADIPGVALEADGIPELSQPLTQFDGDGDGTPGDGCVYTLLTKSVTITSTAAQPIVLQKRSVDGALLLNGFTDCVDGNGVPLKTSAVKYYTVDAPNGTVFIVDYINGTFGLGTATQVGITADIGTTGSSFKFRGTNGNDTVFVADADGAGTGGLAVYATGKNVDILLNATDDFTATAGVFTAGAATQVERLVAPTLTFSLAGGNDTFRAGPTGGSTTALKDTLNPFNAAWVADVYGGSGNDRFDLGDGPKGDLIISGGKGSATDPTADDTDTVSYAERTYTVNVSVDDVRNDGETTNAGAVLTGGSRENDNIRPDVEVVLTGSGDDVLSPGADDISGTPRDGDSPTLTLNGGDGDDHFFETAGADISYNTVFIGGAGVDTVNYSARTAALTVTMGALADDGDDANDEGDDVQSTIENLVGGDGDDNLTGTAGDNIICGGPGTDTIDGAAGNDTFPDIWLVAEGLYLHPEYDAASAAAYGFVCNSAGIDLTDLTGGAGIDHLDYSGNGETAYDVTASQPGAGATVGAAGVTVDMTTLPDGDVENLTGTTGNDTLTGNDLANYINGIGLDGSTGGVDTIDAGGGDDVIQVEDLDSICTCGDGADLTIGCDPTAPLGGTDPATGAYSDCEG